MKKSLFIFLVLFSNMAIAQSKVTVNVANFNFSPSSQTITVGDTIEFINTSGTHWIDGRQVTFPSNPVSFDNQSQSGLGWTYNQVFNTIGNYDYRCGLHLSMSGTIIVQVPANVNTKVKEMKKGFYPNPAAEELFFPEFEKIVSVIIFSVTGEKVLSLNLTNENLDISELSSGTYFVKLIMNDEETTNKLVIQ